MKLLWALCAVFAVARCGTSEEDSVTRLVIGTFVNCMESDLSLCLKEHALKAAQRLGTVRQLRITDSITLINNAAHKQGKSLEPLSTELETRRQQVTQRLWESTSAILRNSDLEYNFSDDDEDEVQSRAIGDEGRNKKKKEKKEKKKLLISLSILAKVKSMILTTVFLGIIAASIFKIALIAKIAFIAKVIAIIKALLASKQNHHQEESWIPHGGHEEHHGWDSGASAGWSRSRNEAQNLAYSAYQK